MQSVTHAYIGTWMPPPLVASEQEGPCATRPQYVVAIRRVNILAAVGHTARGGGDGQSGGGLGEEVGQRLITQLVRHGVVARLRGRLRAGRFVWKAASGTAAHFHAIGFAPVSGPWASIGTQRRLRRGGAPHLRTLTRPWKRLACTVRAHAREIGALKMVSVRSDCISASAWLCCAPRQFCAIRPVPPAEKQARDTNTIEV